jgi:hypothetical protein
MRTAPLQVRATGFRSGERAWVRVITPKTASKRVTANTAGVFVAGFAGVSIDRCSGFTITAVGARGSRAILKRPQTYCPPSL